MEPRESTPPLSWGKEGQRRERALTVEKTKNKGTVIRPMGERPVPAVCRPPWLNVAKSLFQKVL